MRAITQHGVESVQLALYGVRFEKGGSTYDPRQHISLERIFNKKNFGRMVNLGASHVSKSEVQTAEPEEGNMQKLIREKLEAMQNV